VVACGERVLDEEAVEATSSILRIERRVRQRWLAYLEAKEQVKYGSNHGAWDRGDKVAADHDEPNLIDPDWEPEFVFIEPDI
jgi:hypothetical protein